MCVRARVRGSNVLNTEHNAVSVIKFNTFCTEIYAVNSRSKMDILTRMGQAKPNMLMTDKGNVLDYSCMESSTGEEEARRII